MKEMWEAGLVGRVKDGILIDHRGAPYLHSSIHIEAAKFTKEAIEAIEKIGGKAISVYFNKLCLRALIKPHKFRIFPRRPEPVDTRDIDFYCDYENRGYIAMRVKPTYPSPTSVFYGGRTTPLQFTEPELAPLKPTLKLLALREQWEKEASIQNQSSEESKN
ncbi:YmL15 [Coelomomyces lativittatus]|nr:YmL15 [Coelomomyces lativittatus]KAJ1512902.1 YmL15 [Coelomomyces lativittatus]